MHRAVNQDRWRPVLVRLEDAFEPLGISHASEAFVVDDDVKAIRPVGIFVERDLGVRRRATLLHDGPNNLRPSRDSLADDLLLPSVVVAAPAGDEQCPDGLVGRSNLLRLPNSGLSLGKANCHGSKQDGRNSDADSHGANFLF